MQPFFQEYWRCFQELHDHIERAIEGLPQEALDWVPGPDMNSLCVLVVHVTGAERYWIGDIVAGDPSGRDREAEFRAQGLDAMTLKKRLADTKAYSQGVLEKLTMEHLEKVCASPRDGRKFTVAWSLAHALAHTAAHVGHMQITRQLWDQQHEI